MVLLMLVLRALIFLGLLESLGLTVSLSEFMILAAAITQYVLTRSVRSLMMNKIRNKIKGKTLVLR